MLSLSEWLFLLSCSSLVALQSADNGQSYIANEDGRQGRGLLEWVGLGTGPDTDPYLAKTNSECLNGDLAACFQSRALASLDEFFEQPSYTLTENAKINRLPRNELRSIAQEPYQYSESPRAGESEWDQLIKFASRKVEKFLKSTVLQIDFDNEVTEQGRYSPRFVDEILDEVDVIEDKKDSFFKRKQLKKLIIPLLLVLKILKLKLLLFLPLILGLASFKKFLGFLAIIIPGLIGYFKFCKPTLQSSFAATHYPGPHYSSAGVAYPQHFRDPEPTYVQNYGPQYSSTGGGFHFKDENSAQNLAYQGWGQYRSNDKGIEAETTSRKSILPDA